MLEVMEVLELLEVRGWRRSSSVLQLRVTSPAQCRAQSTTSVPRTPHTGDSVAPASPTTTSTTSVTGRTTLPADINVTCYLLLNGNKTSQQTQTVTIMYSYVSYIFRQWSNTFQHIGNLTVFYIISCGQSKLVVYVESLP